MPKFDMRDFKKNVMSQIVDAAKQTVNETELLVECPHCGEAVNARIGENRCPKCRGLIELSLDF